MPHPPHLVPLALLAAGLHAGQALAEEPAGVPVEEQTTGPVEEHTAAPANAEHRDLIARVRAQQQAVASIRTLPFLRDVAVEIESPAVMRAALERDLREQASEGDLIDLAFAWAFLGLAPPETDLFTVLVEVLEEAVGGYYSAEEERLVVVDRAIDGAPADLSEAMESMVVAHELVHALQDQHFDLDLLTERDIDNSDVALAVQALVEGDASYAMLYRVLPDPDAIPLASLGSVLAAAGGASTEMGGRMATAPRALTEQLTFPYIYGLTFIQAVKQQGEGWSAVDAAFARPPLSSEQILHPDKYLSATPDWPTAMQARRPERWIGRGWSLSEDDTLGEFGASILLSESLPDLDARATVRGWDGDRLMVWRRGDRGAGAWLTVWDSPTDAERFAEAAFELARALRPDATWEREAERVDGQRGAVRHAVVRDGATVLVLLDIPAGKVNRVERRARRTTYREIRSLDEIAPLNQD